MENVVPLGQGLYYFITGVWPLLSIKTFQKVTGPKHDLWLVKTTGLLIAVIGAVLIVAALRGMLIPEVALLAMGSAGVLIGVEIVYVSKRVISWIYLLDAVAELLIIVGWLRALAR